LMSRRFFVPFANRARRDATIVAACPSTSRATPIVRDPRRGRDGYVLEYTLLLPRYESPRPRSPEIPD